MSDSELGDEFASRAKSGEIKAALIACFYAFSFAARPDMLANKGIALLREYDDLFEIGPYKLGLIPTAAECPRHRASGWVAI